MSTPHIWDIGTCVMEMIWREMADIIGVPEWDLFVIGIIDRCGHHRESIDCVMTVRAKNHIY